MAAARPTDAAGVPDMPEAIGGYRLIERLGSGSMGQVYKAIQVSMARTVALKVIPDRLANNAFFTKRFLAEARAAGRLVHPHVVVCYDVGQADGYWYMALEFVGGGDAAALVKQQGGKLREGRALEIIRDCAAGLKAIHLAGLIHRDIKPSNILLGERGIAKLGDLGLARGSDEEEGLIAHGGTAGTPAYISPEQAGGATLDIRSDIYSLCATLYKLVTGRPPFSASSVWDVVAQVINDEVPDPRSVDPAISERVCTIIRKGTDKDPARRYGDPLELKSDLELVLAGKDPAAAMAARAPARAARPGAGSSRAGAEPLRTPAALRPAGSRPLAAIHAAAPEQAGGAEHAGRGRRRGEEAVPATPKPRWLIAVQLLVAVVAVGALVWLLGGFLNGQVAHRRQVQEEAERHEQARAEMAKQALAAKAVPAVAASAPAAPRPAAAADAAAAAAADAADAENERLSAVRMKERPEQQIAALVSELKALNSDYDQKIDFRAEDGQIVELTLSTLSVSRIGPLAMLKKLRTLHLRGERADNKGNLDNFGPLRQLPLTTLDLANNTILDLQGLAKLPLTTLVLRNNIIRKLAPLHGMPLQHLDLSGNSISDLSPLAGMPLSTLDLSGNPLSDIAALSGLKLTRLELSQTMVHDLSPLAGMPLEHLGLIGCTLPDAVVLKGLPLRSLLLTPELTGSGLPALRAMTTLERIDTRWGDSEEAAAVFWKRVDDGEFSAKAAGEQPLEVAAGRNVLANGAFDERVGRRHIGWTLSPGATIESEGVRHFLRLSATAPVTGLGAHRRLELRPAWSTLAVEVSMRAKDLHPGAVSGSTGHLRLWFTGASGDRVGPWPEALAIDADGDWALQRSELTIPKGAEHLMLYCELHLATGTVDFTDISVIPR
jgi:hypothetical protein